MRVQAEQLTDGQLVRAALQGDRACLGWLVERHGGIVHHMVRRHTTDPHWVEDLVQDTWLRALTRLHTLRQPERFGSWLGTVARHVAVSWVRQREQEQRLRRQVVCPEPPLPGEGLERAECAARVRQAMERLSPQQRRAVALCALEGQGRRGAARVLGVGENSLKARLARGRRSLQRALADEGLARA